MTLQMIQDIAPPSLEFELVRPTGGELHLPARLFGLAQVARNYLGSARRILSRRCFSIFLLVGIPTTVLAFLLRTLSSIQATRRKTLADTAHRRRQAAQANIAAAADASYNSANSAPAQQEVLKLGFSELQKRLKDNKVTAQTVLASYREQAGNAHARCNCLTEFLPEALQLAQVCSLLGFSTQLPMRSVFLMPAFS